MQSSPTPDVPTQVTCIHTGTGNGTFSCTSICLPLSLIVAVSLLLDLVCTWPGYQSPMPPNKCGRNAMQKQPREHDEDGKKQGDRDQKLKHKESQQRRRDLRQRPDRTRAPRSRQKPTPTAPPSLDSSPLHMASLEAKAKAKVRKPVRAKVRASSMVAFVIQMLSTRRGW